ncbi:PepSY domain-containing protein [Phenylobacterium sp.]|uniref:PepSY domain-containing protein n=1 Tax=Phenylobacterium sp. TaxID=1871053 RepID=UPI00301B9737
MKRLFALAVLAAVVAGPSLADAQAYGRPVLGFGQDSYQGRRGAGQVPLSRVLQTIAARHPGRHLNTTTGEAGGRPAYYVQWQLENGRVVVFVVDAESGQILGRQGG